MYHFFFFIKELGLGFNLKGPREESEEEKKKKSFFKKKKKKKSLYKKKIYIYIYIYIYVDENFISQRVFIYKVWESPTRLPCAAVSYPNPKEVRERVNDGEWIIGKKKY